MDRRAFFASLDPGIFNWNAAEDDDYAGDQHGDDQCRDEGDHYYKQGGEKPLR